MRACRQREPHRDVRRWHMRTGAGRAVFCAVLRLMYTCGTAVFCRIPLMSATGKPAMRRARAWMTAQETKTHPQPPDCPLAVVECDLTLLDVQCIVDRPPGDGDT